MFYMVMLEKAEIRAELKAGCLSSGRQLEKDAVSYDYWKIIWNNIGITYNVSFF